MKLSYQNATPTKIWVVQLPITGGNLFGKPTCQLNIEKITVVAKKDCKIGYKGRNATLTFTSPQTGTAVLVIGESKRPKNFSILASSLPDV